MNILLDDMPEHLDVDGVKHKIHSDFRTWIQFENYLFWDSAELQERIVKCLYLCFVDGVPGNVNEAVRSVVEFYQCNGSDKIENTSAASESEHKSAGWHNRVYSFNYDAGLIYAAFQAQYGIDLQTTDMHWWKFNALFSGLTDKNKICKIMEYRAVDLSTIKDKEQKAFYRKMKQIYRLPDPRSEEEKEAAMMDAFAAMF